jgi:hypothetical protein
MGIGLTMIVIYRPVGETHFKLEIAAILLACLKQGLFQFLSDGLLETLDKKRRSDII